MVHYVWMYVTCAITIGQYNVWTGSSNNQTHAVGVQLSSRSLCIIWERACAYLKWWSRNRVVVVGGGGAFCHYSDVIMSTMTSQITGVSIICSIVCSGADQRNYQSSGGFPSQRDSNTENVSIRWRHHGIDLLHKSHKSTSSTSHNAPFCNRNVHICAHFCYKTVHCGIFVWCIVRFVRLIYYWPFVSGNHQSPSVLFSIMALQCILQGPLLFTWINFNPITWIINYIHYNGWDEINCISTNFNGAVDVWEWISNLIPRFTGYMIIYPCGD